MRIKNGVIKNKITRIILSWTQNGFCLRLKDEARNFMILRIKHGQGKKMIEEGLSLSYGHRMDFSITLRTKLRSPRILEILADIQRIFHYLSVVCPEPVRI